MTPASPGAWSVRTVRPVAFVIVNVTFDAARDNEYEMSAPSFGLSPAYSPCPQLEKSSQNRCWVAGRGGKRWAGFAAMDDDHDAIGDASSRIQMLRPCVPRIRSLVRGCTRMSYVGTVGRLDLKRVQLCPELVVR